MDKNKGVFTAGQFARLHNINRRTLHYYDDIGLFSPEYKGENNYRYYTYRQSATLEMLLTLRELNMSIEEIDSYMQHRSSKAFCEIIAKKTVEINQSIKRLKEIRKLLANKQNQLCACRQATMDCMEIVQCDEEYLLLSDAITGSYGEADFAVLVSHSQNLPNHRMFNKAYGSMLSAQKITANRLEEYDCFFTKVEKPTSSANLFIKPAGKYIKTFCKGNWDKLPNVYCRIIQFAAEQGLTLKGYAYEEGMNEIAISSMEEYVTMITVLCEGAEHQT